jgi:hypothetical protein
MLRENTFYSHSGKSIKAAFTHPRKKPIFTRVFPPSCLRIQVQLRIPEIVENRFLIGTTLTGAGSFKIFVKIPKNV